MFLMSRRGTYKPGKRSHSKWLHPRLSQATIIAGTDGSDAKPI
jgi:hypothetical protein